MDAHKPDGLRCYCKPCSRWYTEQHRLRNPERGKTYYEENKAVLSSRQKRRKKEMPEHYAAIRRKSKYGLTPAEYVAMLHEQGGTCAICDQVNPDGRELCVDHCHETGDVRGLLCHKCNTGIGLFGDNAALLNSAISYLREKGN